ncbi:hypothetical protein FG386_002979 [Cryptosporidium ryanae]|uniref:uncharacterized protein n=1 Tax=Cryptosporidium ryanae TaxID=515981 RepID=UPI00351A5BED|nr:hypothetical protein FG386_002979 [Cryptosporidium ryanae]
MYTDKYGDKIETYPLSDNSTGDQFVSLCLFRDVENIKELTNTVVGTDYLRESNIIEDEKTQSVIFLNARMIYSVEHILNSISICVLKRALETKRKTKTFETEVIYNMSPSTNITYSLKTFGMNDKTKDIVCVFLNMKNEKIFDVTKLIKGNLDNMSNLNQVHDVREIKKVCFPYLEQFEFTHLYFYISALC